MAINTLNAIETSHTLPTFLAEKIQRANYSLTDVMHRVLTRYEGAEAVLAVCLENIETFNEHAAPKATLMNMPFLALLPTLPNPRDWETFVDDVLVSPTVADLASNMPAVDGMISRDIFHYNCYYVTLLKDVLHMNILAAPLLGITFELAEYLTTKPMRQLEAAIGRIKFPLFRWRFEDTLFWKEYCTGWLSNESVAHYLMRTSQIPASTLPYKDSWSHLRLERAERDGFARLFIAQGCRASTAVDFFNLNRTTARTIYKQIHGVSSPVGCRTKSLTWYVQTAVNRVQATFVVWLYRCALQNGANIPEALIATNDIAAKLFGDDLVITADRANHLAGAMAMDSRLSVAPCRSCKTDYVLANEQGKIELAKDFVCPGCNYSVKSRLASKHKKARS
ncbi:hypothetical protein IAG25_28325 [Caballeronia sp. EK]|uniref:FlhC family transcriptional regulator n=1 Tax=Caballeronia sp. EK TaxID=2767469 RepID=UPI0016552092|nr:FlhC family transcriptional regulator [Caballeronia sp. EK]MBC8640729.1 hypothetical protein [Caballeronia sp. EK]